MSDSSKPGPDFDARLREAIATIELVAADGTLLDNLTIDERARFHAALSRAHRRESDPADRRRLRKADDRRRRNARVAADQQRLHETGIRELRRKPVFTAPRYAPPTLTSGEHTPAADVEAGGVDADGEVRDLQSCYTCKRKYSVIHHFYDQLCPECAELNFRKRTELADLRGRVAVLTGGRVKIGYQAGLKLLRAGAHLIVTTRFPRDSAARYAAEDDFADWGDRLEIFGLDLRHTPSVDAFCRHLLSTRSRLDFIVNNACQTVRRPPDFYAHMMDGETRALRDLPEPARRLLGAYEGLRGYHMLPEGEGDVVSTRGARREAEAAGLRFAAELSQVALLPDEQEAQHALFPQGRLDQDLQQVDLRDQNSWRLLLGDVSSVELLEVHLVNAVAPFILNARLKPLMLRTPERDKHIVNVSAMEGQFYRTFKTTRHPHTNMAKAALNMMTRTSAADYYGDGIHMNSVDTGWVTDEDPAAIAARKTAQHHFHPPLDIIDGAARIVDPIIDGFNTGTHVWGQFLKDYKPTLW